MVIQLNNKGQAALMDAVLFLTIVASISTGLLYFTVNYGTQSQTQLNSFYSADFAADALKVITYVNVTRNGTSFSSIAGGDPVELDYLLALVKEDYADKKEMSQTTITAIKSTFESVLKPYDSAFDYDFYLYNGNTKKYLFMIFATHECTGDDCNTAIGTDKEIKRVFYYCQPDTTITFLEDEVYPFAVKVDSAYGKITLSDIAKQDTPGTPFLMSLNVWITKNIKSLSASELTNNPDLKCKVI